MSARKLFLLCLCLLAVRPLTLFGQQKQLAFDHLDVQAGLPENRVTSVIQDKYGYIWLGTQNGLVRYDGKNLKVYKIGAGMSRNFNSTNISSVYEDLDGNVWVTERLNGLFRFDRSRDRFIQYSNGKPGRSVDKSSLSDLVSSADHSLWLISRKDETTKTTRINRIFPNGRVVLPKLQDTLISSSTRDSAGVVRFYGQNYVYRYDARKNDLIHELTVPDTFKRLHTHFTRVFITGKGNSQQQWMLVHAPTHAPQGLAHYDARTHSITWLRTSKNDPRSLPNDTIYAVFEDSRHRVWMTSSSGLSLYDNATRTFTTCAPNKVPYWNRRWLSDMTEAPGGKLWISSQFGLYLFDPATKLFTLYNHSDNNPASLGGDPIDFLYRDKQGSLWIGVNFKGIDRLNDRQSDFTFYRTDGTGTPVKSGHGMLVSPNNDFWIVTGNQLYRKAAGTDRFVVEKVPYTFTRGILLMYCDRSGRLWMYDIATDKKLIYSPATGKIMEWKPANLSSISPTLYFGHMIEDRNGKFWIGTYAHGLMSYDEKTNTVAQQPYVVNTGTTPTQGKLDDDDVLSVFEDTKGRLWIGTNNGGLNLFDRTTGKFRSFYNSFDGLQCVTSIMEDHLGRLWLGTYLNGVFLFDPAKGKILRNITEATGLLADFGASIFEDKYGMIWVSSERGFTMINPTTWKTRAYRYPMIMNSGWLNGGVRDAEGTIYYPLVDGLMSFNPDRLSRSRVAPQLDIASILISDKKTGKARTSFTTNINEIRLPWHENTLAFRYIGMSFSDPAGTRYLYRLEGYDHKWISSSAETVLYANLSPGTYTFRLKAANGDGVWTTQEKTVRVVISPPWWKTWWALLLEAALVIAGIARIIVSRSKKLKEDNRRLEEKVAMRTEELEHSLDNLKRTQAQLVQSEKMASLGELTAGIAHEIQNPLNFVNNFAEVSTELIGEMTEELENGDKTEAMAIAADIKQNLEKIRHHGKRADNIVKGMLQHSRSGAATKEAVDINAVADEYLRLAYHGLRAKDKTFNATLETDFDPAAGKVEALAQELGRVILNLLNNAFYAVNQRRKSSDPGYQPMVRVSTQRLAAEVVIRIRDNGAGIPQKALDKIFQPFFTTKPTGEGTGLGLSLSYEIITKGHNGTLDVTTKENEFTEFRISLPA